MTNKAKIKQQIEIIRKKTFLDATLDRVFKMLFSVDSALIHFLNAILHLPDATKIVSISRPKKVTVKLDSGEGSEIVRFDIHAKLKNKQFIDLEMQRAGHTDFLDRIELYSSLLEINSKISFDKGRPKREKNVHPYLMPETYSIWLCNFKVPFSKSYREELGLFRLSDIGNPKALPIYTKKRYIIIDLTKYKAARNTPEAEWLKLIATSANATSAPKTTDKAIADAYSRLQVKNASRNLITEIARDMVTKAEILTRINDARVEARQDTARKMLEDNEPIEKICRYTDLDQADVLTLQKEMSKKKPASRLARV